jgi:predicted HD phosphohydrolase
MIPSLAELECTATRVESVISLVRKLRGKKLVDGCDVYDHSLQAAALARDAGADADTIVAGRCLE